MHRNIMFDPQPEKLNRHTRVFKVSNSKIQSVYSLMSCTDVWVQNRCQIILETHQTGERLIILNVDEVRLSLWQWGVGHISKISKAPLEQMWKHILVSTCGFSHLAFKAELHMTVRNIWFLCLIVQKKTFKGFCII